MASEKVTALLEEIKKMSVLELSELVHAVEEEFGVSAAAAVAVAGPAARSSKSSASSPVSALLKLRLLSTVLRRSSKRLCRRKRLKKQKPNWKKLALLSPSNKNCLMKNAPGFVPGAFFRGPHDEGRFIFTFNCVLRIIVSMPKSAL